MRQYNYYVTGIFGCNHSFWPGKCSDSIYLANIACLHALRYGHNAPAVSHGPKMTLCEYVNIYNTQGKQLCEHYALKLVLACL